MTLGHVVCGVKKLEIGAHTYIRSDCVLSAVSSIGRFCSIGSSCFVGQQRARIRWTGWIHIPFNIPTLRWFTTRRLRTSRLGMTSGSKPPSAMILEGVNIGTGAVIATRALVAHDVPPYAIVAGTPAKVVKYRHTPS